MALDGIVPQWHAIQTFPAGRYLNMEEEVQLVASLADAIAVVIEAIDHSSLFPDSIFPEGEGLTFYRNGEPMVKIFRVVFENVPDAARLRCEGLLKGLHAIGDNEKLIPRLKTLPGFKAGFSAEDYDSWPRRRTMMAIQIENFPIILKEMLVAMGVEHLRHAQVCDLAARMFGVNDWQTLKGRVAHWTGVCIPHQILQHSSHGTTPTFYRSNAEAIWGFQLRPEAQRPENVVSIDVGPIQRKGCMLSIQLEPEMPDSINLVELSASSVTEGMLGIVLPSHKLCDGKSLKEVASGLNRMLCMDAPLDAIRESLIESIGDRSIRVGHHYLRVSLIHEREFLTVLKISDAGEPLGRPVSEPLYKADLDILESSGELALRSEYGRELAWVFDGVPEDRWGEIGDFTGLLLP
jgi:hypothetical protein